MPKEPKGKRKNPGETALESTSSSGERIHPSEDEIIQSQRMIIEKLSAEHEHLLDIIRKIRDLTDLPSDN